MSIMDLGFSSGEDFSRLLAASAPQIEKIMESSGLAQDNRVRLMQAGYSPKEIFDLTDREVDALFQSGFQALGGGDLQGAQDTFGMLCKLDSLDARFPFALATTYQLQGKFETAAKLHVVALGLDATNVDGYLQLGECLLAARELDNARDVFEVAAALVERGHGEPAMKAQAEAMLSVISEASDARENAL
ncbi:tetratricopeptide repeat protein [Breoghania corrubedonensis]|uniref:Tetratricopeptide repeat protein n=1 Tax=Breoghania corrubedonensis TaxID=665038 RepID=A0A2T5UYW3_9HYPH|nr:tetratricopeptide repeat protein [Breoghania corrubedonensis]PTW56670.1 tetratricopeptide repeat protein [Breoghania corrubedonensis]